MAKQTESLDDFARFVKDFDRDEKLDPKIGKLPDKKQNAIAMKWEVMRKTGIHASHWVLVREQGLVPFVGSVGELCRRLLGAMPKKDARERDHYLLGHWYDRTKLLNGAKSLDGSQYKKGKEWDKAQIANLKNLVECLCDAFELKSESIVSLVDVEFETVKT